MSVNSGGSATGIVPDVAVVFISKGRNLCVGTTYSLCRLFTLPRCFQHLDILPRPVPGTCLERDGVLRTSLKAQKRSPNSSLSFAFFPRCDHEFNSSMGSNSSQNYPHFIWISPGKWEFPLFVLSAGNSHVEREGTVAGQGSEGGTR